MSNPRSDDAASRKGLWVWPGVVLAAVTCLVRFGIPMVAPDASLFGMPLFYVAVLTGILGGLATLLWWLFFSRAPWPERVGVVVLIAGAMFVTSRLVHSSISNGMMGMMLPVFGIPVSSFALAASAAAASRLSPRLRRVSIASAILLACGAFTLLRTNGVTGDGVSDFRWRWTLDSEERLLARSRAASSEVRSTPVTAPASEIPTAARASDAPVAGTGRGHWPGFRGADRDGIVRGVRIRTDWSASPPFELWRRPIGPGWSSFAVGGDLVFTQEQRGEEEIVAAYDITTGDSVWQHLDPVRFWESNGGAGPRGTPTVSNGRVYAVGATGIVKALDEASGAVVWSRDAASDTGRSIPNWGISSSPLVIDDVVAVAVSGTLAAYDIGSGRPRWFGPAHGGSYSSPHLVTIDGVAQILMLSGDGATGVAPADGRVLWEYAWPGFTIVQPAMIADGDVLISTSSAAGGVGTRRIAIVHRSGEWTVEERWTSAGLKPYFNDLVVHKGHAFGFDGSILACIDLQDGRRTWKGGRYGHGQLLLLPDQDLLLVLSEEGELALVGATPDQYTELARFKAIEGKTWNHPVLVGDVLLVRNGQELVAFRLSLAGRRR